MSLRCGGWLLPESVIQEKARQKHDAFSDMVSEVLLCRFHNTYSTRFRVGGNCTGCHYQEARLIGGRLGSGDSCPIPSSRPFLIPREVPHGSLFTPMQRESKLEVLPSDLMFS